MSVDREQEVVTIVRSAWVAALGTDVGDDVDFFESGGDSLAAARIVDRIGDALDVDLPLSTVLDRAPTISSLTGLVTDLMEASELQARELQGDGFRS